LRRHHRSSYRLARAGIEEQMTKKNIVIQLKGAAKPVASEWMEADEAERLLREEVVPKIGT
jgi:hypothetical protein